MQWLITIKTLKYKLPNCQSREYFHTLVLWTEAKRNTKKERRCLSDDVYRHFVQNSGMSQMQSRVQLCLSVNKCLIVKILFLNLYELEELGVEQMPMKIIPGYSSLLTIAIPSTGGVLRKWNCYGELFVVLLSIACSE